MVQDMRTRQQDLVERNRSARSIMITTPARWPGIVGLSVPSCSVSLAWRSFALQESSLVVEKLQVGEDGGPTRHRLAPVSRHQPFGIMCVAS